MIYANTALFMYSAAAVKKINSDFLGKHSFQQSEVILISAISLESWGRIGPFYGISKAN